MISNNVAEAADFKVEINHNNIPQTNNVKYLGCYFRQYSFVATAYR